MSKLKEKEKCAENAYAFLRRLRKMNKKDALAELSRLERLNALAPALRGTKYIVNERVLSFTLAADFRLF